MRIRSKRREREAMVVSTNGKQGRLAIPVTKCLSSGLLSSPLSCHTRISSRMLDFSISLSFTTTFIPDDGALLQTDTGTMQPNKPPDSQVECDLVATEEFHASASSLSSVLPQNVTSPTSVSGHSSEHHSHQSQKQQRQR